ncbi:MAG: hypothetical protein NTX61_14820 [Bacteroidetes bacterium]|nr:hypothetical protein [Bacteroidota bacterium]
MGKQSNFFILFWILLISLKCSASGDFSTIGGRAAGMGFTSVAVSDPWSVFNNPAGLAMLHSPSCGVYFENRFLVTELSLKAGCVVFPVHSGTFGISFREYGFSLYNEIQAGLAFARKFGRSFSVGVQLDYLRIHLGEDLGTRNLVTFDIGLQFAVNHQLTVGVHCYNPVPAKLASYQDERIPTVIRFGLSERFSENFIGAVEIEKDLRHDLSFKTGMEYHFVKPVFIRVGLMTNPAIFTFGFGIEWGKLMFDLGTNYHRVLGYSPEGSIIYRFK